MAYSYGRADDIVTYSTQCFIRVRLVEPMSQLAALLSKLYSICFTINIIILKFQLSDSRTVMIYNFISF
jgi:hypothetical protein